MKSDEFRARYKLLDRIASGSVLTFRAETPAGEKALVHILAGPAAEMQSLTFLMDRLSAADREFILETLDVEGTDVVVTRSLDDFESLPSWLKARRHGKARSEREAEPPAAAPAPEGPPPATPFGEPGEFTAIFKADREEVDAAFEEMLADSGPEAPSGPQPAGQESGTGEFTGLFGAVESEGAPAQPSVPKLEKAPEVEEASPLGEEPAEAGSEEPAAVRPEEPARAGPEEPATVEPEEPATAEPEEPGEFTRLFGVVPPAGESAPPSGVTGGEESSGRKPFIRWREDKADQSGPHSQPSIRWKKGAPEEAPPAKPGPPATPAPPPKPAPPPLASQADGGGEFTELFHPAPKSRPDPRAAGRPGREAADPAQRETRDYLRALGSSTPAYEAAPPPPPAPPPVAPLVAPPSSVPPAAGAAPPRRGPSEFTLVTSGESRRPGTSSGPAYEDEGEAEVAQGPRVRTLIIGLSLVIVAVIAVVVAFLIWGG
ncbi:MAG TPA: hypothetical protein VLC48_02540 [Gemmatimonadota bacterium]|nr:hypothetical protein [Gemmatimonadota bacterium]